MEIASRHGLKLIEDVCQAHGSGCPPPPTPAGTVTEESVRARGPVAIVVSAPRRVRKTVEDSFWAPTNIADDSSVEYRSPSEEGFETPIEGVDSFLSRVSLATVSEGCAHDLTNTVDRGQDLP